MFAHKHLNRNENGRDYVVGDIHGMHTLLNECLAEVNFDEEKDRLICVGDLADRGAESSEVMSLLSQKWFHSVMGNHEHMLIEVVEDKMNAQMLMVNGGAWFFGLPESERKEIYNTYKELPLIITVDTQNSTVGICHSVPMTKDWKFILDSVSNGTEHVIMDLLWGRGRWSREWSEEQSTMDGIELILCGHTPCDKPTLSGNVLNIDTGAFFSNTLTVLELESTLKSFRLR